MPGRGLVVGVVRRYAHDFPEAERALLETVMRSVCLAFQRLWGEEERERLIGELRETMVGTAAALATALDERDDYTGDHARDIAELAVALGERLGVGPQDLDDIRFGAIFHDIGKIAVPDEILRKPCRADRGGARGDAAPHRSGSAHPRTDRRARPRETIWSSTATSAGTGPAIRRASKAARFRSARA